LNVIAASPAKSISGVAPLSSAPSTSLRLVELIIADRAHIEAAALLDELSVDTLDGRVLVGSDAVGIAAQGEPDTL